MPSPSIKSSDKIVPRPIAKAIDIDFNADFQRAADLLEKTKKNLFITGKAGTGKSTLLSWFNKHSSKSPVILAPTGVSALNVNGQTIHNFFTFGVDINVEKILKKTFKPRKKDIYDKLEIIIIDEISMVRADLLDCIDAFLRIYGPNKTEPFGGVQMVFIGDLYQLPPILQRDEKAAYESIYESPYFFSAYALQRTSFEVIELEHIYRQKDQTFVDILNRVRNNSVSEDDIEFLNTRFDPNHTLASSINDDDELLIYLTTTNKLADDINQHYLDLIDKPLLHHEAEISGGFGHEYYPTTDTISYKAGAQIMLLNNDSAGRWVNGSLGVIKSMHHDDEGEPYLSIDLQTERGHTSVNVSPFQWEVFQFVEEKGKIDSKAVGTFKQFPVRLAWAVTIHKSQGKTFDKVNIDLGSGSFASGQVYVALSRCRSLEGINLRRKLRKSDIRTDMAINKFITECHYAQAKLAFPIEDRLALLSSAIASKSGLVMTYLTPNNLRVVKTIHPLEIQDIALANENVNAVSAYFQDPSKVRVFVIDRILQLAVVAEDGTGEEKKTKLIKTKTATKPSTKKKPRSKKAVVKKVVKKAETK